MYNMLGLKYPDDEEHYASNWSTKAGEQQRASYAVHIVAAPPFTALATLRLYL